MVIRLLFMLIVASAVSSAGVENNGRGTKARALANAFVAVADDPWAVYYNPAGLSRVRALEASIFFVPAQFELPELRTSAIAAALPIGYGTLGASVSHFGFELYRETHAAVGYGEAIDWGVAGGIGINFHRFSFERYGAAQRITVDVGLLGEIDDKLTVGFSHKNLFGERLGRDRLPQVFSVGIAYAPVANVMLVAELEKEIRYPLAVKAGAEYVFIDILTFRAGVGNNPDTLSAGFALKYAPFEISYAGYSHPQLGWTHQLDMRYRLSLDE